MIPTHLCVRNFMCYRGPVELDLRGIRLACLSGDNGAGKSALLDSITWALWGKARVSSDRDLMALGAPDMEVTYSFILGEQEFRVTRRRSRSASSSLTLDIQALDGDRWRSLAGSSVRETQQTIDRLLRMDYETFINSAFILQGRADEFTTKTPALRKQVLSDILNLSDYDRYEEIARQLFRERERQLRDIDDDLVAIDERLAELPTFQAEVTRLSQELLTLSERAEEQRAKLAAVQARVQSLEFTASQREMVRGSLDSVRRWIAEAEVNRQTLTRRVEEHQAIIARRPEIEARHQEWLRLREELDTMAGWLADRQELMERRQQLEKRIQQAIHKLESEIHSTKCQIGERDVQIREKPDVVAQLEAKRAEIAALAGVDAEIDRLRRQQSELEARRGALQEENRRLKEDMADIKARLDQVMGGGAICPVCRRELGAAERERLEADYRTEGTALGDRYRANGAEMKQIQADLARAAEQVQELERRRTRVEMLERRAAALAERLERIERAEAERESLVALVTRLEQNLAEGRPGLEWRDELREIEQALASLPYDREAHGALQARVRELAPVEHEYRQLHLAQAALERDEAQLETISLQIEQQREELSRLESEDAALASQLSQLEPLRCERDHLQAEMETIERERGEAQERFGAAQQRLNDCLALQDRREELVAERGRLAEEKKIYDELTLAFGKRGIQAMIIENILPELQEEANAILDKMPGNTMRIEFRTQRQTVRGEGTIETLDIVIGDEAGSRPYELYSGGEAFRANFAIRVALSTLLARRAGTRLQTLVIDEGFGTQDNRGRDGLIEAIRAIERDFQTILVITHIAELKEMFPTRIEVAKTPDGSQVQLV